jgi:hypothetical protein
MAAAVVRGGREIASSCVHGQDAVHRPYGGVVPELASRDHVRAVHQVVERALAEAGIAAEALDGIAVTAGPGLVGSLLVGLSFGKALAYRLGIPLVGVHHLSGHLASAELADAALEPPYLGSSCRAATPRCTGSRATPARAARRDARRRGRRGVRQGRGAARPGLSRRSRGGARGRARRSGAFAFPRPARRRAGLRLLVQRSQDRGGDARRAARRAR